MSAPPHFLLCQWGLRTGKRIRLGHPQRFGGKSSHDSWHSQSSRRINVQDICVGIWARDQSCIQQAWQRLISRVARTPGHFVRAILAGERRANQNRLLLLVRCLRHKENFSFYLGTTTTDIVIYGPEIS
jgi:hypothetical protein